MLTLLSVITYAGRLCISVAGPAMQKDLGLSPSQWGWVMGAFALTDALFEIPSGAWGDAFGHKQGITRIVIWWSCFTGLTGLVGRFDLLVAVRALFGMGEAGAYPNILGASGGGFRPPSGRGVFRKPKWLCMCRCRNSACCFPTRSTICAASHGNELRHGHEPAQWI
ncbi:MAG: MFS transporter [Candidatus Sumerlaeia bacterium]|nr:MFS transporter [Candidatus Sumerlaeia bacterium]